MHDETGRQSGAHRDAFFDAFFEPAAAEEPWNELSMRLQKLTLFDLLGGVARSPRDCDRGDGARSLYRSPLPAPVT